MRDARRVENDDCAQQVSDPSQPFLGVHKPRLWLRQGIPELAVHSLQ